MGKKAVLEKFDLIVKGFSKKDRIALVHDLDADGVSSGAITFNAIKFLRGKEPDLVVTQQYKTVRLLPKTIQLLKKNKINKIVCVDFAFDQQPESLKETESIVDQILVLDHHKDYKYAANKKTFILKANYIKEVDPSKYPTSKLVFDLFSRHVNLEKFSWVASVGLIGDNQLKEWEPFVQGSVADHNTSLEEIYTVTNIISAIEVLVPEKLNDLLYFIANSSKPKDVIKSKFAKYSKTLDAQVSKILEKFEKKKEVFEKQQLVWFEFEADSNIKSAVINKVSNELYPNKTIIFIQDKNDGFVSFSARRQDFKVKTNDLLEKCVKGFENAGAGGHIPAAAGRIMKKDLAEFKKRVLKELS
ncbi:MAG TPA: DHHA1 domain-containing protein [archaeon]|nr:DHHA1 domain-containing protein [archaeon]